MLDTIEPVLNHMIRRGRITPPPPVVAGRRQWSDDHIVEAARLLGRKTDEVIEALSREVHRGT